MAFSFKEWFAKIQEESIPVTPLTAAYKAHYPFIEEGYSDLLEDSDWYCRDIV